MALNGERPPALIQMARLATYEASTTIFRLTSRCKPMLHWYCLEGLPALGSIYVGAATTVPGVALLAGSKAGHCGLSVIIAVANETGKRWSKATFPKDAVLVAVPLTVPIGA